jgi:hypothetical protein
MTELDASGGFDVHDYRHGLKLLKQDRETTYLDNREGFGCPACGRAFDRLFVSEKEEVVFDSAPNGPVCLVRAPEKLLVLTH